MKEFKGTKGEWFLPEKQQLTGLRRITTKGKNVVTLIAKDFDSDKELEANAQLIAAAPDLLKALQESLPELAYNSDKSEYAMNRYNKAKKAINKALGQ